MSKRTFFVTATGTDAGKTHIGASLIQAVREKGLSALATKPLMSGFADDALALSDAGLLAGAMGVEATLENIQEMCPWRFEAALAPHHAAKRAGVTVSYEDVLSFCRKRDAMACDVHFVEGAGGVMSPLTTDKLNLDLIADLDIPAILIVPAYLGAVSHALTAIVAMRQRHVSIAAIVINDCHNDPVITDYVAQDVRSFAPDRSVLQYKFSSSASDKAGDGVAIIDALLSS